MIRFTLCLMGSLFVALIVGGASAWFFSSPHWMDLPIQNGPWRTSPQLGGKGDTIYVRAYVARVAWFSNDPDASMYFTAFRDSDGRRLDARCTYRVSGVPLDARWWSITAYKGFHWIPNPSQRYSFAKTNLAYAPDGSWTVWLSAAQHDGNWLPLGNAPGELSLLLRLYDPAPRLFGKEATIPLPRIERSACP